MHSDQKKVTLHVKAKFHYAIWLQAGPKLVADRFEAKFHYTILVADLLQTCLLVP